MLTIFVLLMFAALILLVVGLIAPKTLFWSKKKTRKMAWVYLLAAFIFAIPVSNLGNQAAKADAAVSKVENAASQSASSLTDSETYGKFSVKNPNTSEAVDNIIRKAREDAKTATPKQIESSKQIIIKNLENIAKDDKTMEQVMYHGAFLEYACKDSNRTLSNIGMDAEQAVKYQYRGGNGEDEINATKENVRQIRKGFDKLNK